MIRLTSGAFLISCDETDETVSPWCMNSIRLPLDGAVRSSESAVEQAREHGWRAFVESARRDLCPMHREQARRAFSLIPGGSKIKTRR